MDGARSTTSYALLGLLSVRSWSTYELAKQVQRSLNWFWPRAERRLYDEPKSLVSRGLATAQERFTGRRRGHEYTITDEGRAALARWLDEPSAPRTTEFEAMLKVFFADAGELDQLQVTLGRIEDEARGRIEELRRMAAEEPPFPERRHLGALTMPLYLEQEAALLAWAQWARVQVSQWVSTRDPGAWDAGAVLAELGAAAPEDARA
jgi:PadR family transcriptional regulator AphA